MLKPEIEAWVDTIEREFAQEENRYLWLTWEEWLEKYVYSDIHEVFFGEFPTLLNEWLLRLTLQKSYFEGGEPKGWKPELIQQLKKVEYIASRAVQSVAWQHFGRIHHWVYSQHRQFL